jgi:hypothetical protein
MMLSAELMCDHITSLERANEATTKRRQHKKKRIQKRGTLTKGEGEDILARRRPTSRWSVNSVKVESNQALAAGL